MLFNLRIAMQHLALSLWTTNLTIATHVCPLGCIRTPKTNNYGLSHRPSCNATAQFCHLVSVSRSRHTALKYSHKVCAGKGGASLAHPPSRSADPDS